MFRNKLLVTWILTTLAIASSPVFAQSKPAPANKNSSKKANFNPKSAVMANVALGRLATEQTVFFLASNGWKKPDDNSRNKAEKLWAEESIQDFVQQLNDEIKKAVASQTERNQTASLIASAAPVFLRAAIEHPLAISLQSFTVTSKPEINLSIVIDTESDKAQIRELFEKLIAAAPKDGPDSLIESTIDGTKFYRPNVSVEEVALAPQFGMYKSFLVATIGPNMTAATVKKIADFDAPPAWFDTAVRALHVERPSLTWHINVEEIWNAVDPLMQDPKVRPALEAAGLLALKRVSSVVGLDSVGSVDKMMIETTGAPQGILALLAEKPLTTSDLKRVPGNPAQATVVRFNLALAVETILKIAERVEPTARQQYDAMASQCEQTFGFSLKEDLLKAFDDVWSVYVSGSEPGGGFVPSLVISANVRDQKRLIKVQDALLNMGRPILEAMGDQAPVSLHEFTSNKMTGYRVQINNMPIPVSPTWIVTRDQFVLGLTPQLVTAHLSTSAAANSMVKNEDAKAAFKREPKTVMFSYRDPKSEIQILYTLVNSFSPMLTSQLQQQGIKFNLPPLPPFSDLEPHLAPSVSTLNRLPNGWRSECHGVVPSITTMAPVLAAVGAAIILPATGQARQAAQITKAQNNLKQIALAMHNYHDINSSFPERVVFGKNKKPGLSWRVKLLPQLDHENLYQQFHLNEPWDSEHNKTLILLMPTVFSSPTDPDLMTQGKTRFVIPVGKGFLFDGDKGPKMQSISDGTSNTIMVLEARPDHATVWTKPEDLEIDPKDPLVGLKGNQTMTFFAVFADGSVRALSDNTNAELFLRFLTKAGGEDVSGQ
jgi:hypothetical protein